MPKCIFALLCVLLVSCSATTSDEEQGQSQTSKEDKRGPVTLVIHGGAGGMDRSSMSQKSQNIWKTHLNRALDSGYKVLANGGTATEAVQTAIVVMENDSFFNAGKGAVFTHEGKNELDASIMKGSDKNAGAVAGVTDVKNPIKLARTVMNKSKHVMLSKKGASKFAEKEGLNIVPTSYFFTQRRYKSLQRNLEDEKGPKEGAPPDITAYKKYGTVGAVALDDRGNLAAGTSTGGMTNKKFGRIGDSPIIGAGTYADNKGCAVSATGHGEFFIRNAITHDVNALVKYKNLSLEKATDTVIHKKLAELGGTGGVIALNRQGNKAMTFNTSGMFRAFKNANGETDVRIFKQ